MMRPLALLFFLSLLLLPLFTVAGDCDCSPDDGDRNKSKARPLKIAAFFSILVCGAIGVCLPILSKSIPALSPENDIFFVIKAFAAGVILATGFIHILPDAFENLTSPCLNDNPWGKFPFAGFGAMLGALGTLMVDTLATSYFSRAARAVGNEDNKGDAEMNGSAGDHRVVHVHATHGHAHGPAVDGSEKLVRNRVISQAKFKIKSIATMILFFSLTTPVGIAIGFGISTVYNENSPTALIVEGCLNSVAAGILIYMALVDLLAEDFMNPRVQSKGKLQFWINVSLLIGAGLMSLLAKWA
ncbi:zinc transporter 8 isoform X2 [Elaeis guineensis]|uniref:Zinc transporter 8 isoform X2 n=1 Tax=Elaeis guineensis var. tenera TaxID=51953 RepID=A0A8N4EZM9_ELAGV|nr:zinc transporter 8 isoform X2 [Elaeis guineensis]